jgi:hypothetical protein
MRETTQERSGAPRPLLDTNQAARFLKHSARTLANWRGLGKGPVFIRSSRKILYDPRDLDAYLDARRFRSTSEADHSAAAA